ncbi:hypothetical protein [Mariniflexile sp. HMF6888]|uniref:hypothetical protein n=1 Tax=Mariniflexile sp. HMF6888 TaxID=3373086 RepID=UPI0037877FDE
MKRILNIALLVVLVNFISCTTNESKNTQQKIFKAIINGQVVDYGNPSSEIFSFVDATLWDNKRLVINGWDTNLNTSLELIIGETFIEEPIHEGIYKIGTLQDDLETNLFYFNSNDTNMSNSASSEYYLGVYGCNVLASNQVGEINITDLDRENKIVSGTFNGTLFRWLDVSTGESKSIEIENGIFTLPYIDKNEELNPDRNLISARVNGFRFMSDDPGSPNSRRSEASGIDKIVIHGYDGNFGRMQISILSNVKSGNNYLYQPNGSFQSLGVNFVNRINIPEGLLTNNPNQSNDSFIHIISHDPEKNTIEGTFYIENSEIEGRTVVDGYFNVNYIDDVD